MLTGINWLHIGKYRFAPATHKSCTVNEQPFNSVRYKLTQVRPSKGSHVYVDILCASYWLVGRYCNKINWCQWIEMVNSIIQQNFVTMVSFRSPMFEVALPLSVPTALLVSNSFTFRINYTSTTMFLINA